MQGKVFKIPQPKMIGMFECEAVLQYAARYQGR